MAEIDLKFEDVDRLLAYDPATGVLRWKVSNNNRIKVGSVAGSVNGQGYIEVKVLSKQYQAHRLAWLLSTGDWPSQHLDHKNGQRDDNRIGNLRECRRAENMQNMCKYSNNTSGVLGVGFDKTNGKWRARIMVNGKNVHIGYFETLEEASAARAAAKQKYHTFNPVDRE